MLELPTELERLVYWGLCRQDEYDEVQFERDLDESTERGTVTSAQAQALRTLLGRAARRGSN